MHNNYFPAQVKKYFHYLIDEFHYSVIEKLSEGNPDYGVMEFRSSLTIIRVTRQEDRPTDIVHVVIRPSEAPDDVGMSLRNILDSLGIRVDLPDDHVPPQYFEDVLKKYAQEMREHCLEFINGDFSRWSLILQHYLREVEDWYKSILGEELPTKGRYQVIENFIRVKELKKNIKK